MQIKTERDVRLAGCNTVYQCKADPGGGGGGIINFFCRLHLLSGDGKAKSCGMTVSSLSIRKFVCYAVQYCQYFKGVSHTEWNVRPQMGRKMLWFIEWNLIITVWCTVNVMSGVASSQSRVWVVKYGICYKPIDWSDHNLIHFPDLVRKKDTFTHCISLICMPLHRLRTPWTDATCVLPMFMYVNGGNSAAIKPSSYKVYEAI